LTRPIISNRCYPLPQFNIFEKLNQHYKKSRFSILLKSELSFLSNTLHSTLFIVYFNISILWIQQFRKQRSTFQTNWRRVVLVAGPRSRLVVHDTRNQESSSSRSTKVTTSGARRRAELAAWPADNDVQGGCVR
jgi:hypothetical protein